MANHDDFFAEKKPAAVVKHGVLGHYVKLFTTLLGSKAQSVWVIDAFAGPGEYESDADTPAEPGSPKILCDIANSVSNTEVHGVYIEENAAFVAQLSQVVAKNGKIGHHTVLRGTAETNLDTAVKLAGNSPVLIFLDPFGAAVSMDTLVGIIKARPKWTITEILLNFNVEAIWRVGGYLTSKDRALAESNALTTVDKFVGGEWWRRVFLDACDSGGAAAEAAQAVAEEFNRRLHAQLSLRPFTVPIRRRPGQKPIFLLTLYFKNSQVLRARLEAVRTIRAASPTPSVQRAADTPWLFTQRRQPTSEWLAVPRHSSEHRICVPMTEFGPEVIAGDALSYIEGCPAWVFVYLQSSAFTAWVATFSGALESRFRISPDMTYNVFPFVAPEGKALAAFESAANRLRGARAAFPNETLATLYDSLAMPKEIRDAHAEIDRIVDGIYGLKAPSRMQRVVALLARHHEISRADELPIEGDRLVRRRAKRTV